MRCSPPDTKPVAAFGASFLAQQTTRPTWVFGRLVPARFSIPAGSSDLAFSGSDGTTDGVYLLSGPLSGRVELATADAYITGERSLGSCIASAGDIDRDGRSDLLLGDAESGTYEGLIWLQYGPVSGTLTISQSDAVWSGDEGFYRAGSGCAGPGDVTGDGGDDMLVTSTSWDGSTTGQVFVLEGVGQ